MGADPVIVPAFFDPTLETAAVESLTWAYRHGYFPMAIDGTDAAALGAGYAVGDLVWLTPDPRGVLPLTEADGLHVPRRLAKFVRGMRFVVTSDVAFSDVMRQCALPRPNEKGTWISEGLVAAYSAMFAAGRAHSVEVWAEGIEASRDHGIEGDAETEAGPVIRRPIGGREMVLVGGTYGVHLGAVFFAESKFHRADLGGTNASKVALVSLVRHLAARGFALCDTQMSNEHIAQFGVREVPRGRYLAMLRAGLEGEAAWGPFEAERLRG